MELSEFMIELEIYYYFGPEKYDVICNKTGYLISQNSSFTYAISLNYAKIKTIPCLRKNINFSWCYNTY